MARRKAVFFEATGGKRSKRGRTIDLEVGPVVGLEAWAGEMTELTFDEFRDLVDEAADMLVDAIKLELRRGGGGPGRPPARIEGNLERSVGKLPAKRFGNAVVSLAGPLLSKDEAANGAAAPYAEILEFGGFAGRDGATRIEAHPYVRPAEAKIAGRVRELWERRLG